MEIKRSGSQPSGKGPAVYFTGAVRIDPLFEAPEPARARGASVTFVSAGEVSEKCDKQTSRPGTRYVIPRSRRLGFQIKDQAGNTNSESEQRKFQGNGFGRRAYVTT